MNQQQREEALRLAETLEDECLLSALSRRDHLDYRIEAAALLRSLAEEPHECKSNDSPWLVCVRCRDAGRCLLAEEPQAEPVAYVPRCLEDCFNGCAGELRFSEIDEKPFELSDPKRWECAPLYTHPPAKQEALTEEEIWRDDGIMAANAGLGLLFHKFLPMLRAVESACAKKWGVKL